MGLHAFCGWRISVEGQLASVMVSLARVADSAADATDQRSRPSGTPMRQLPCKLALERRAYRGRASGRVACSVITECEVVAALYAYVKLRALRFDRTSDSYASAKHTRINRRKSHSDDLTYVLREVEGW